MWYLPEDCNIIFYNISGSIAVYGRSTQADCRQKTGDQYREEGQVRGRQYYPKKQNNMLPIMAGILGVVLIALLAVFGVNYYKAKMDSDSSSGPVETTAEADRTDTESVDEGTTDKSKDSDQKTNSETKEKSEEEPEVTPTSTPTPVPTLTETPKVAYIDMEHIQNEIFRAKGSGAQESLYLRDCIEDAPRGTGEKNTAMPATGMVSVPILYTLAVKMDDPNSGITLNTPVTFQYTYDTYSGGRGHLTSAQSGQQMSIDTLVQEMLMYSDNNATNSLISFLTLEGIQQTCQENDFTSVVMRRQIVKGGTSADDNLISAKDATNMVYELFMNEFSVINRDYLMNYMRICDNAQRHAIFQSDTLYNGGTFCNQNGIRPNPGSGTYAEVGIILADGQQYIVCVMSDGGDADLASNEFSDAVNYIHTCMLKTH
ncbi:MAG: serine hydrolase [Eubacteriales bacterium]|nr:serine hydrolase [Eubacteriales bacterium]